MDRVLIDDMGNEIKVKEVSSRVAMLLHTPVALQLSEFNLPVIGGCSLPKESELFDYGSIKEVNIDAIKSSRPDLIIGIKKLHKKIYEKLNSIAPTFFLDPLNNHKIRGLHIYDIVASLMGKSKEYNLSKNEYLKRVDDFKKKLPFKIEDKSAVLAIPKNSRVTIMNSVGAIFELLDNLGFKKPISFNKKKKNISFNELEKMKVDFIFVPSKCKYYKTEEKLNSRLDGLKEGSKKSLQIIDSSIYFGIDIKSINAVLDDLEERLISF